MNCTHKCEFIEKTCLLYVQHIRNITDLNTKIKDNKYNYIGFHSRLLELMFHPEDAFS